LRREKRIIDLKAKKKQELEMQVSHIEIDKSILEAQAKKSPNLGLEFTNLKDENKTMHA
jgi:hypothetical protein